MLFGAKGLGRLFSLGFRLVFVLFKDGGGSGSKRRFVCVWALVFISQKEPLMADVCGYWSFPHSLCSVLHLIAEETLTSTSNPTWATQIRVP